ncbi:hypothetical protein CCHR01_19598, partial [Colletotrichum chrysophilum]
QTCVVCRLQVPKDASRVNKDVCQARQSYGHFLKMSVDVGLSPELREEPKEPIPVHLHRVTFRSHRLQRGGECHETTGSRATGEVSGEPASGRNDSGGNKKPATATGLGFEMETQTQTQTHMEMEMEMEMESLARVTGRLALVIFAVRLSVPYANRRPVPLLDPFYTTNTTTTTILSAQGNGDYYLG